MWDQVSLFGTVIVAATVLSAGTAAEAGTQSVALRGTTARVSSYEQGGRLSRLYGEAFSHGASALASAEAFLAMDSAALGTSRRDLVPYHLFFEQPISFDRTTGQYRFTGVYYEQQRGGVSVFRSRLLLLTRNDPGFPLVLASADLRELGGFEPALANLGAAHAELARQGASMANPDLTKFGEPQLTIWAGIDDMRVAPRLAWTFIADDGIDRDPEYQKWLFVIDARSGEVLFTEDQVVHADVSGNVSGYATSGVGVDECEPEVQVAMPYARVDVGGTTVFADANGDYIASDVTGLVNVSSPVRGLYFNVINAGGAETVLSQDVTAPATANFVHNADNDQEFLRAEVNAYVEANFVRDLALRYNPAFPVIGTQTDFPVNVNINATCNATYSGSAINFYRAGGGCANMATASIIHHEYGHHLVAKSGNGQWEYGEGMGDTMAVIALDDPGLAWGVFGDCSEPGRTADNDCQYQDPGCSSCGSAFHECGQLLSGCVWSTRQELVITEPEDYLDILSDLVINAMFLHSGRRINPSITIDFLTLDDDNADIFDGTPHYDEIAAGFGAHNMDAPPLTLVELTYPDGRPEMVAPSGGETLRVEITPYADEPVPGEVAMIWNEGSGEVTIPMVELGGTMYEVTFPAATCGATGTYYFSVGTLVYGTAILPESAPAVGFEAVVATASEVVLSEDFEEAPGWTTENIEILGGAWDRGVPAGHGDRGDPLVDADGSGACYLTENGPFITDVNGGPTRLISPPWNLTSLEFPRIVYSSWFTNDDQDEDRLRVEVSNDDGATWVFVIDIADQEGWVERKINISDYVVPTSTVRVRFSATDNPDNSMTEAGIDAVSIVEYTCDVACPADIDGSGDVGFADLLALLAAWGECGTACPADLDGDSQVGFADLLVVLEAWGQCP